MSQAADKQERLYTSVHQEKEKRVPAFIKKNEKISATSKGTVIHKVLELLNFSKDHTMKSLNEDIKEWIDQGKLKKEYDKVIYRKEILALTNSQLGKRMKTADQKKRLYKERQFVTGIPFSDMNLSLIHIWYKHKDQKQDQKDSKQNKNSGVNKFPCFKYDDFRF